MRTTCTISLPSARLMFNEGYPANTAVEKLMYAGIFYSFIQNIVSME